MPWQCKLIDNPELDEHGNVDLSKCAIGDMWYLDVPPEELKERNLTAQYFRDNAGRKPLVVLLPGPCYFLLDGQGYNPEKGHYDCWTVAGVPPNITVAPSVNYDDPGGDGDPPRKHYHGFIQNGVIGNG